MTLPNHAATAWNKETSTEKETVCQIPACYKTNDDSRNLRNGIDIKNASSGFKIIISKFQELQASTIKNT
jgi:hypothetical protein